VDARCNAVRKVNSSGYISTIAGNGTSGYSGDGGPATNASLNSPFGVALNSVGDVYISDKGNNVIRKIDTSGHISTVAGNGTSGYSGDGGPATNATMQSPKGINFDSFGNMFLADAGNNVIRKVYY
jgi:hypothetical protein